MKRKIFRKEKSQVKKVDVKGESTRKVVYVEIMPHLAPDRLRKSLG